MKNRIKEKKLTEEFKFSGEDEEIEKNERKRRRKQQTSRKERELEFPGDIVDRKIEEKSGGEESKEA